MSETSRLWMCALRMMVSIARSVVAARLRVSPSGLARAGVTEALVAGTKSGLALDVMLRVLQTTMAWNNALAIGLPRKALKRDFNPGFMTRLAHKDVGLALAMTRAGAGSTTARVVPDEIRTRCPAIRRPRASPFSRSSRISGRSSFRA